MDRLSVFQVVAELCPVDSSLSSEFVLVEYVGSEVSPGGCVSR